MNIKYLKEFSTLAELCNYQEAAEQLYISQSTLSKHISKMEQEFGVLLFDRTTRAVKLTQYGNLLMDYAAKIISTYDDFTSELTTMQQNGTSHLTISFTASLTQYGILEFLSQFIHQNPNLHVSMVECSDPVEMLQNRKCDIAFTSEYGECTRKFSKSLYEQDSLVAVVSQDHPFANRKSVSISDLMHEKFILKYNSIGTLTQVFRKACLDAGFDPQIVCYVSYSSAMMKLASESIGIAILHRKHCQGSACQQVSIVDIEPAIRYNIYVLYSDSRENIAAIRYFRKFYQTNKR